MKSLSFHTKPKTGHFVKETSRTLIFVLMIFGPVWSLSWADQIPCDTGQHNVMDVTPYDGQGFLSVFLNKSHKKVNRFCFWIYFSFSKFLGEMCCLISTIFFQVGVTENRHWNATILLLDFHLHLHWQNAHENTRITHLRRTKSAISKI